MQAYTRKKMLADLRLTGAEEIEELSHRALQTKLDRLGNKVFLRGLIEFSNICRKNCRYCGLRRDAKDIHRYLMAESEILDCARRAYDLGFGSVVLQSGENTSEEFIGFLESVVRKIMQLSNNNLRITLCSGEQSLETYRRWLEAGAHRYLLRIESSNPAIYRKLHPADHDFNRRLECLGFLRECGYQVGTGVLIGVPGQTAEDLANDVEFFRKHDIDMIGMGPYLVHPSTPMAEEFPDFEEKKDEQVNHGIKMIAATRLALPDVNIASTTALQTLHPIGRERGLLAGANVIMPNLTPLKYREDYFLYEGKPVADEGAIEHLQNVEKRLNELGLAIGWNEGGDSLHYSNRV